MARFGGTVKVKNEIIAVGDRDVVRITVSTIRRDAIYEADEVKDLQADIVDDIHAVLTKKFRVSALKVK